MIHRGFEIHPEVREEGMPLNEYFPNADRMFGQLKAYGEKYNLPFAPITMMPNTNKALQVGEYAKEIGLSDEFNKAMYKAVFADDINISLEDEIIKIASSVGIDDDSVRRVWERSIYADILEENKVYCKTHNITSVPTFIINDRYAIVGAQGKENFIKVFDQLKNL